MPWGTLGPSSYVAGNVPRYGNLTVDLPGSTGTSTVEWNSLAQTARQSTPASRWTLALGAQTIPAGTWAASQLGREGNTAANLFSAISIYVYRPSTNAVVGYVYDSQTELGVEFGTSAATAATYTVAGASVTAQNADLLVVEVWYTAAQGMATSYPPFTRFDYKGTSVGSQSYIQPPTLLKPPAELPKPPVVQLHLPHR
jgi:hypothetical protein